MRYPILLAAVAAFVASTPVAARTAEDEQLWLNATVMGTITGKLAFFAEVQPRLGAGVSRLDQLILRPAIGWKVTPTLTLYQGYAHVVVPVDGGKDRNEERSFQQISWTIVPAGRHGELQSRSRLEQRWRSDGRDMAWRVREMLRYERPFSGTPGDLAALGSIEGFFALDDADWGPRKGFDQVRAFAGLEVPIGGKSTVEIGYLNQTVNATGGNTRMNHIASISLFYRP